MLRIIGILKQNLKTFSIVVFLLITLPLAVILISKSTENRKMAASTSHIILSADKISLGDVLVVKVNVSENTAFATAVVTIDPNSWEVVSGYPSLAANAVIIKDKIRESLNQAGQKVYKLEAGAHDKLTLISGNLMEIRLKPLVLASRDNPLKIKLKLRTVNRDVNVTFDGSEEATVIVKAPLVSPAPTMILSSPTPQASSPTPLPTPTASEPTNSVSVGSVQSITTGSTITGYKVVVTLIGSPIPSVNFDGENAACAIKLLGALPDAPEADIKSTLAGSAVPCIQDGITTYEFIFSSAAYGQQRKIWASFHNDNVNIANNYWPNTRWSTLQSSAAIDVPLNPTPINTPPPTASPLETPQPTEAATPQPTT